MFDHISIGVTNLARSKRFYDAALAPLGHRLLCGYGRTRVSLWILTADRPVQADPGSGLHFCFTAPDVRRVGKFYAAALANGGEDNGTPGQRFEYAPDYYAAYVFDPDGYRLEAYAADDEAENPRSPHVED